MSHFALQRTFRFTPLGLAFCFCGCLCPSAPSYKRPYSPSPLRALVSSEYSNKHHHHHFEGWGAPADQPRRQPAPDKETVANFQQSLCPSRPPCLCPPLPAPSDEVQGVAIITTPLLSCLSASSFKRPYFLSPLRALVSRRYSNKHLHYLSLLSLLSLIHI